MPKWNRHKYMHYLTTSKWRNKRRAVLLRDHHCQICNCKVTENLQVHHLTYDNCGNEPIEDLIAVCHRHHAIIHAC